LFIYLFIYLFTYFLFIIYLFTSIYLFIYLLNNGMPHYIHTYIVEPVTRECMASS
ncbi:hypothetical protein C0J52_20720, partial [Blattella germanica]